MMQQVERNIGRFETHVLLLVLEHHVVHTNAIRAARLAKRDLDARFVLQLNRNVLQHMSKPRAFVFSHATYKAARFAVRASMLAQSGKRRQQAVNESVAEPSCRPRLERTEIENEADDGEMRIMARADIDRALENFHVR